MADPPDLDDAGLLTLYRFFSGVVPARDEVELDDLRARLEQAHSLYMQGGVESRRGMCAALGSVIAYMEGELDLLPGHADRLLLPLRRLLMGLEDLEVGVVHPPLMPAVKRSGGTKLTKDQAEFRLIVCLAVKMLVTGGASLPKARKDIAKRLKKGNFRRQRKDVYGLAEIDEKTIEGWQRQTLKYWSIISTNSHLSFDQWLYIRTFIGFSHKSAADGSYDPKPTPQSSVEHIFKVVLPIEFGHLRSK